MLMNPDLVEAAQALAQLLEETEPDPETRSSPIDLAYVKLFDMLVADMPCHCSLRFLSIYDSPYLRLVPGLQELLESDHDIVSLGFAAGVEEAEWQLNAMLEDEDYFALHTSFYLDHTDDFKGDLKPEEEWSDKRDWVWDRFVDSFETGWWQGYHWTIEDAFIRALNMLPETVEKTLTKMRQVADVKKNLASILVPVPDPPGSDPPDRDSTPALDI